MEYITAPTQHIHVDDKLVTRYKDVSEHHRDCNGNSIVPMSKVEGSLDLVIRSMGTV